MLAELSARVRGLNPSQTSKGLVLSVQYCSLAGRGQMLPAPETGGQGAIWVLALAAEKPQIGMGIELERPSRLLPYFRAHTSFQKDYLLFRCNISRERFLKSEW